MCFTIIKPEWGRIGPIRPDFSNKGPILAINIAKSGLPLVDSDWPIGYIMADT